MLRLPLALLGAASVLLVYQLARDLLDRESALTAAWLAALSPLLIWYSQEARSYSFLAFLGLIATVALVRLCLKPHPGWWLLFVAGLTASLYTHYLAVLLLPAHVALLTALVATRRSRARVVLYWLAGCLATAAAYLPWLRTPAAGLFVTMLTSGRSYPAQLAADRLGLSYGQLLGLLAVLLPFLFAAGLFLFYRSFRRGHFWRRLRGQTWVLVLVVLALILSFTLSVVPRGYTIKRQLVLLWPLALIPFAYFLPWRRSLGALLTPILLLSLLASLINIVLIPKDQWRETVALIQAEGQPGDVVLLLPSYMTIPFDHYDRGRLSTHGVGPASAPDGLAALAAAHQRIWLVYHQVDVQDPGKKVEGWLAQNAELIDARSLYHIQINLYRYPAAAPGP